MIQDPNGVTVMRCLDVVYLWSLSRVFSEDIIREDVLLLAYV